jgi:CheY-like chemotaxis protein
MKSFPTVAANILLVDENRDGLLVRRALLEEHGFQVEMAQSGEEGLNLYRKLHFDVVVTGYRMPRMSGTELIERLRRLDPQVRVVLLSGIAQPLGLTEENTGADTVLAKDSREQVLLVRSVKRLLSRVPSRKPPRAQGRAADGRLTRPKAGARTATS